MATLTQDPGLAASPPEAPPMSLADLLAVVRRWRWWMLATFVLLAAAGVGVAFGLPAVYRSTATILIKEQEIPQEFVRSTVTSFADERIQVISQQVLTRATLLELVDRHGLYGKARQRDTSEEILERMRRDIRLAPISADVTDRRTGQPAKATIAFSLSFDSEEPANAQKIASELTTLFLNENLKTRQQKAAETTSFIDEELQRITSHIAQLEEALTDFKRRHQGRTPDQAQLNLAGRERAELELQRIERDVAFLQDRRFMLQRQLAETRPSTPLASPAGPLEVEDRLRALRSQIVSLQAVYGEQHPDVRRVRREIAALEAEAGPQVDDEDRSRMLARLRAELQALRERYSDQHPDVLRLRRTYEALEATVQAARPDSATAGPRRVDNPVYQNLQTQLATTESQIESLLAERKELQARQADFVARLAQSGEIEREFLELVRDMDASRARFRDLRDKQMQAQVAEQLERSRKAERFTIIEPPVMPERPYRPNRPLIMLLGLALAAAGAVATAALAHALDGGVHGPRDLQRVLQVPVLAVWPRAERPRSERRRGMASLVFTAACLVLVLAIAAVVHWGYVPLDVAWFSLLRRMGL